MNHILISLVLCAASLLVPRAATAGARRFNFVYEVTTSPPGDIEVENWITWKAGSGEDHTRHQVDFRHELEFGITEKLQAAIYLADWNYHRGKTGQDGFSYTGSAVELIYNLTNPVSDPLGIAVYEEIQIGDHRFESESKLLAQKNFGRFVAAYNATLEAEWEGGGLAEREGEFQQSLGLSYEISPRLLIGAEALHEIPLPDWSEAEESNVFVGPNLSIRAGTRWVTLTGLAKLAGAGDEPDFQFRTIFGFSF